MTTIILDGDTLDDRAVAAVADGAEVGLAEAGLARMARRRAHLMAALEENRPIYGVTTGLGPRVVERLSREEQIAMSLKTIRGRAHAAGPPMEAAIVRGAMAVRANTLLRGASGADPALAHLIVACLNADLAPVVPSIGSIGAADLMWGGHMGLGLIGEGEMTTPDGIKPAGDALAAAGLKPYAPGPREGLALASHSSFVAAMAAIALVRTGRAFQSAQTAAALTLEGFRANLTPFREDILAERPQPGQSAAAAGIRARLEGSALLKAGHARRVQDPLSIRNIPQVHGTVVAALETFREAVLAELNGASDNPVVLDDGDVLSSGGYLTPYLAITATMTAQAFVHLAAAAVGRMSKAMSPRFSDLPVGLAAADTGSAGMAPAMKTAEALFAEVMHAAQPAPVYPGGSADGVEDVVAQSAVPVRALLRVADSVERLAAMELLFATQAVEIRGVDPVAPRLAEAMARVRAVAPPVREDRSLAPDIEAVSFRVAEGDFI